jgi:hypothetical protein
MHFTMAYECSEIIKRKSDSYILINSNKKEQNKIFHGKPIYSPDVLRKENGIDTILVFSLYYKEIVNEIRVRFPGIEPIVFGEIGLKIK